MLRKFFSTIEDWYYDIKYGIPTVFRWFKTVWAYRWWDWSFFVRVLIFMLKNMEHNFRTKGNHTTADKQADQMRTAWLLLDRTLNFDYHGNVFKDHDKKWGKPSMRFEKLESDNTYYDDDTEYSQLHIDRKNVTCKSEEVQERKEYRRLMDKPDQQKQRDLEAAMRIISKHLTSWWN